MQTCPCGSTLSFSDCCEPYLKGTRFPDTAEKLMRSRYTAFAVGDIQYLEKTLAPEERADFDFDSTSEWAKSSKWKGLKILSTTDGLATDKKGVVEFVATYEKDGETVDHHEVSEFRKNDRGQWLFVNGEHASKPQTVVREQPKVGRNDPCTCGSGKKFKKCCGA